jgi:hypothetical protein
MSRAKELQVIEAVPPLTGAVAQDLNLSAAVRDVFHIGRFDLDPSRDSVAITLELYSHVLPVMQDMAVAALESVFADRRKRKP